MNGRRFPRMDRLYERIRDVYLTADLRSLSAGRIVLALVLLRDLFGRWAELGLWYTNDGIIPNHTMLWRPPWDHVFSLFYLASYTHEAVIGFIICLFAFLALLVGFRTKLAQIASLICMLSLHGRTLLFDNGGDVVLGLLVWWTTFLPTGRHFSVDAVLARRRAAAQEAAGATPSSAAPAAKNWVSLAVLAVIGQLAICYFFNAIHKQGSSWRNGSAVHYAIHLDRLATWFAVWLRDWMSPSFARGSPTARSPPRRCCRCCCCRRSRCATAAAIAMVLVVGLHLGFAACLNLGNFVPAMIAYAPSFMPGEDWDALGRWWARSVKRVDLAARIRLAADVDHKKRRRCSRPGAGCAWPSRGPSVAAVRRRLPAARELTVVMLMGIAGSQVLDENWSARKVFDHHNAPPVAAAVSYLGMFQGWSMFAPEAPMTDFNLTVDAVTSEDATSIRTTRSRTRSIRIPASPSRFAGSELALLRLRQPHPQPRRRTTRRCWSGSSATPSAPDGHRTRSRRSRCGRSRTTARRWASRRRATCAGTS